MGDGILTENSDKESFEVIEAERNDKPTTPSRIDLKTIDDVRVEMARVYREMRANKVEAAVGTKLVYVLSAIGKLIEVHEIEKRITKLEEGLSK
jgi:hypothetical protein